MVLFQYRAADHSGKVFEGTMEAEQVVVSQFHAMGCTPLRTAMPGDTPKRAVQIPFGFLSRERITQWELLYFTQELSALLGVGRAAAGLTAVASVGLGCYWLASV